MDAAYYKSLGRRIAALRKAKGLTQEGLAEETTVGASYIARIEIGQRRPTLDVLGEIAEALDTPVWHLLTDRPERLAPEDRVWKRSARALADVAEKLPPADLKLLTQIARRLQDGR